MKPFLKIEEIANLLDLDYKTVYRLVLSGQLPALKIGAIYRIRQEDLDRFLESQKVSCRAGEVGAAQTTSCARCGLAFRVPSLVAGKCQQAGCDAPLCTNCWEKEADRFCSEHARPEGALSLEKAERLHRQGELPVLVKAEAARQLQLTFIGRFDQAVRGQRGMISPREGGWVQIKDWATVHREEPSLLPLEASALVVRHTRGRRPLPQNITSFYYISSGSSKRDSFAIGVASFSHIATYAEQGFDTAPATLGELLHIIDNALGLVRSRETLLVMGVASTTGWQTKAEDAIRGSATAKGFSHDDLVLCLVDLYHDRLVYNPGDSRIRGYLHLFAGETDMEKEELLRELIQKEVITGERLGITAREVCEMAGARKEVVEQLFYNMARQGGGRVEDSPDGLIFLKDIKTG